MIKIIQEFIVKEDARGQFELAFGPGGVWSKLVAECPGFRGTSLLRDTKNPRRYLTIEFWDTETQREQMLTERRTEYAKLEEIFSEWTEAKMELGTYRLLAEGTVHPHSRARRGKARKDQRRSRRTTR